MPGTFEEFFRNHWKKFLVLPPLILGGAVLTFALESREPPAQKPLRETATKVRVIEVPEVTFVPRALGYGTVQPGTVWEAVAEVGGAIVHIHPHLKKGAILAKGEVLVRIDPTRYELAVAQTKANIRSVQTQLAELDVKERNTLASSKIEERSLALRKKDLERKRELLKRKNVSQAAVDLEERNVLDGRQSVQSLKNTLRLIPAERQTKNAQLALYQAQLESARLDLKRTTITAPFDARISAVNVQETQFAAQNKVLATADSIGVAEVAAQLPVGRLFRLVPQSGRIPIQAEGIMNRLPDLLGLSAVVRLQAGRVTAKWNARFARISDTIDPVSRTVGVIVAVDNPYAKAVLGVRPPLTKNMFVEVELRGKPRPRQIVVPRAALHDGVVYTAGPDNRLKRRAVDIAFFQTNFAVLHKGLSPGDRIVITDLIPAVDGMLLEPVADGETAMSLIEEAEGRTQIR